MRDCVRKWTWKRERGEKRKWKSQASVSYHAVFHREKTSTQKRRKHFFFYLCLLPAYNYSSHFITEIVQCSRDCSCWLTMPARGNEAALHYNYRINVSQLQWKWNSVGYTRTVLGLITRSPCHRKVTCRPMLQCFATVLSKTSCMTLSFGINFFYCFYGGGRG